MEELRMTEGFDVGMEMSGVPAAFRDMLLHMNHGGKVALLGIPPPDMAIDWNQVIFKGLEIKGIYGREMFETWYKMVAMLQSGLDLSPIITHHYAAEEFRGRVRDDALRRRAARSSSTGRRDPSHFRLAGVWVAGIGLLYVLSGRPNTNGLVFSTLLDRPLVLPMLSVLWHFGMVPGTLAFFVGCRTC